MTKNYKNNNFLTTFKSNSCILRKICLQIYLKVKITEIV